MTNPTLISTPFAADGDKSIINDNGGEAPNSATWKKGFPEITQTPITAGGIPPKRTDFNGVLNAISENIVHQTKGLGYEFDAAYAAKIGGYPLNARLTLSNGDIVRNTVAGNTNDPNVDMTGWVKTNAASQIVDKSGKTQQYINDFAIHQFLSTDQFPIIIPEIDDTGRLQRAFDASFDRQQTLTLVGDFNCSDVVYARHDFDGSSSKITYPQNYNKDMLFFAANKAITTTRVSGKTVYFPSIYTTKTSGVNNWTSNVGSCAIKIVNPQECRFTFGETNSSELGIYVLAYNTDANYNTYNFCRHVYHKRCLTFHVQGDISVASMNQNTLNGGRFAVNNGTSRIAGIYLHHFLITGATASSCNNNLINNPSVEGGSDECAIRFENLGTGSSGMSYNTIISPRLESNSVAGKQILFTGALVRWNRVMYGYGVNYDTVVNSSGALSNTMVTSIGSAFFGGSLGDSASLSLQNTSGAAGPVFAIYAPSVGSEQFTDAKTNSNAYATSAAFITRSGQSLDRFSLTFASGRMQWGAGTLDTTLYRQAAGRLKTDGSMECGTGLGVFGATPPTTRRTIVGKKTPTSITEQNDVLDSIVAALVSYGLVDDNRTA